jgi:hypothetical protein
VYGLATTSSVVEFKWYAYMNETYLGCIRISFEVLMRLIGEIVVSTSSGGTTHNCCASELSEKQLEVVCGIKNLVTLVLVTRQLR